MTEEIEKIENDQQEEKKKAKRDAKKEKLLLFICISNNYAITKLTSFPIFGNFHL